MTQASRLATSAIALVTLMSAACSDTPTTPALESAAGNPALFSKGGGGGGGGAGGGGGGGGGGATTSTLPSPLPTTPPAPDVLLRESFGFAAGQRPQGDKGTMRVTGIHSNIDGYWVEYPGSKNTQWLAPATGQTWNFAGCSDDPNEMPSPIQTPFSGCVVSEWSDPVTSYPTALMPFPPQASDYELSMDGYPAPIPNAYIAIGFTNSAAITSNLTTSGTVWLRVRDLTRTGGPLDYELRTGGLGGTILAAGSMGFAGWNRMVLRISPANSAVTLTIGGSVIGTYHTALPTSRYVAFEGVGVLDNFVVRR
jgi:hypothetical protein